MVRWHFSGPQKWRVVSLLARVMALALLLALGALGGGSHAALAVAHTHTDDIVLSEDMVHTATSSDTFGDYTLIDDPNQPVIGYQRIDQNPNTMVTATGVIPFDQWFGSLVDTHPIGVWYDASSQEWAIFNEDLAPMQVGDSFNVDLSLDSRYAFVHHATVDTITGYNNSWTYLSEARLNGNPSAQFVVTQNWNPGGGSGIYNNHPIGVWYDQNRGQWLIYNEDGASIPPNASFTVLKLAPLIDRSFTQVATPQNTIGSTTCLVQPPPPYGDAIVWITHLDSGFSFMDPVVADYSRSFQAWCIHDPLFNDIPIGTTFFLVTI